MTPTTSQQPTLPYPQGLVQFVARFPIYLYRLGLGPTINWIPFMILTTRGRKSSLPRYTVVEYRRHGSKYYIVSGWGNQTQWYQNIKQDPRITIQHGSHIYSARAEQVENPAEALRALYMFSRNSWIYESLFARMSSADAADLSTLAEVVNEFTVIRIIPDSGSPTLPPVPPVSKTARWFVAGFVLVFGIIMVLSLLRRLIRM